MRTQKRDIFTTVRTEGNLLPMDLLQRVAEGDRNLEGLAPEAYHIGKNERLNEVINRAWKRCQTAWAAFQKEAQILPEADAGTTLTRERWLLVLFQELAYGRLLTARAKEIDGKTYPISHFWNNTPIHLVSFRHNLDRRTPGVAGAARLSPHGLIQEFLNRSQDHLWGMVSNGLSLRLLRDNASLTRQAYVEFDLDGMMSGEVYSDFILLFLLLHQSRVEAEKPEQCWLEQWTRKAQEQGTRALDQLRSGVEQAIISLGKGFLAHAGNAQLREKLRNGDLDAHDLYQQLLRLIYRLIFLFVAEDRNLLLLPEASEEAKRRYLNHYSLNRIRRMAGRVRGTRHADLWEGLRITFRCLYQGEPALGIDPLGGFLFSPDAIPDLNDSGLSNESLLEAIRHLSYTREGRTLRPVDYRNLGTEELGSVYESLLELHPEVNTAAATFDLRVAAGSDRKTTGSYYTPSSLINCLLDSALEPVIETALQKPDPEKALLDLKIVDPASGSGHFLIAAAHRMAKHLAMLRTGEAEPAPEERREAIRDVVSHCIYGVDLNPLAVELCKVALWIETLDPGKPLGFLDHHIKCGNSLIGATPELLEKGIPDDAFKPVTGDDRKVASAVRKKNHEERKWNQKNLFSGQAGKTELVDAIEEIREWGFMPEDSQQAVNDKADKYKTLMDDPGIRHSREVADLWTSAFFWPLTDESAGSVPTEDVFRLFQEGSLRMPEQMGKQLDRLARLHRFFHWHLVFPEVFSQGGFDVLLGNPPWERIQIEEKQFFSISRPDIAAARSKDRQKLIKDLKDDAPTLFLAWEEACRVGHGQSHFVKSSGCYPNSGKGNVNTFSLFAELASNRISQTGRVGLILPSGIITEASNEDLFRWWIESRRIIRALDFENSTGIFPDVHRSFRFCLLTLCDSNVGPKQPSFCFFLKSLEESRNSEMLLLGKDELRLLNPSSLTCPPIRSLRDAQLLLSLHRRFGIFVAGIEPAKNPWCVESKQMLNSSHDSESFVELPPEISGSMDPLGRVTKDLEFLLRLYDGKMVDQFDHRLASTGHKLSALFRTTSSERTRNADYASPDFLVIPQYWVAFSKVSPLLPDFCIQRGWWVSFRAVTASTNWRTIIASVIPLCGQVHSLPALYCPFSAAYNASLVACLNSFALDYCARLKLSGTHLSHFIFKQLPVPPPDIFAKQCQWSKEVMTLRDWLLPRVLELTCTAWDLEPFAQDCRWNGPPFSWDEERRFLLRCELDAAFFHLYLGSTDEWHQQPESLTGTFLTQRHAVDYIMETFPIVKRKDEQKYGDYRTKRVILECYDAMAEALKTGKPYQTILDPPPGPPVEGLPEWKPGQPKPKDWPLHIHPPKEVFNSA